MNKERPILFSGPMVKAILEGRKTQTRRVMKPPLTVNGMRHPKWERPDVIERCPYGQSGDRLWVRETLVEQDNEWVYAADETIVGLDEGDPHVPAMISWAHHKETSTCVSIHMPRWASRLTLEITEVRVERLQEISRIDAQAEGMLCACCNGYHSHRCVCVDLFWEGWDKLNAKRGYSWESNPWVWAISFRRV